MQEASTVRIVISDTGKAMNKELVNEILSNTYQADNDNHGFGYKIILELLVKIHGALDITTGGETGNKITLIFQTGLTGEHDNMITQY
jgi:sensor histidine kinase regulating citrate/malate metabolism